MRCDGKDRSWYSLGRRDGCLLREEKGRPHECVASRMRSRRRYLCTPLPKLPTLPINLHTHGTLLEGLSISGEGRLETLPLANEECENARDPRLIALPFVSQMDTEPV
jgi:hypothetical protein